MTMRSRSLVLVFLAVALSVVAVPSAGAHGGPPRVELHVNNEQTGLGSWSYSWSSGAGRGSCSSLVADGIPNYEPDAKVDSLHARPRIYFLRDQRPRVQSFRAYSKLDENGWTTGPAERIRARLSRVRQDGEVVAWKLRFRTEVVDERYFDLDVSFEKLDRRCGDNGEASYAFGLERE